MSLCYTIWEPPRFARQNEPLLHACTVVGMRNTSHMNLRRTCCLIKWFDIVALFSLLFIRSMQFLKKVWTRIVFDEARAVFHGMGGLIKDQKYISIYIYIYFAWLSVYLYPSKRLNMTPGKVYGWSNFQKFASIKFDFHKIFKNFKSAWNLRSFFALVLQYINKVNMFTIKMEDGHEAP